LLQSSSVAYNYGVSGPFWYASGATVQILLFASIAIELKRRAPNAHTFLEVIKARFGTVTHLVFAVFGIMTNVLVTAMLLTGGAAVISSLTGMVSIIDQFEKVLKSNHFRTLLLLAFCSQLVLSSTLCSVVLRLLSLLTTSTPSCC
jgi:hypothetical protein